MALSDLRAILTRPLVGRVFNCGVPLQLVSVGLPSGVHVSRRTLLLAGAALPLAGCSTSGQWQAVTLDAAPAALAPLGTGLLIGTAGPALAGPAGAIAVTTSTPYGNEANWVSLATHGERIVGLGTTHGGAHANNRWTTFTGTTTAVTDLDQPFDVFHGWGAGQLVAAVLSGDQPVIVGSWQSPIAGNDVAVWLLDGSRWTRRESAGTPLASTTTSLVQAAAAEGGTRLMVAGQAIELSPLRTRAMVWTTLDPRGDWAHVELPSTATTTSAQAIATMADGWLVAGRADDQLIAWTITADLNITPVEVPQTPAGDSVQVAGGPDRRALIVAADGARVRALVGRTGSWQSSTLPGTSVVAAAWSDAPAVITRAEQGTTLYRLR